MTTKGWSSHPYRDRHPLSPLTRKDCVFHVRSVEHEKEVGTKPWQNNLPCYQHWREVETASEDLETCIGRGLRSPSAL